MTLIAEQIQRNQEQREMQLRLDKRYKKPHFGPEETDYTVQMEEMQRRLNKEYLRRNLIHQIQQRARLTSEAMETEKSGDQENIRKAI
jgi:hypothetical protein